MTFMDRVWSKTMEVVQNETHQPHLQELVAGTLPIEKFRYQIMQNYKYLLEYAKVFALAIAKSPDYQTMARFRSILDEVMENEVPFYRKYYQEKLNIDPEELDRVIMDGTNRAYTSHERACSWQGDLAELVIAVLPCAVCYREQAKLIDPLCKLPKEHLYREWIDMYLGEIFTESVSQLIELANELAEHKTEAELKRLEEIYYASCMYELLCWDTYYNMKFWPLPQLFKGLS